jgi:hypothetical protein
MMEKSAQFKCSKPIKKINETEDSIFVAIRLITGLIIKKGGKTKAYCLFRGL